MCGIAGLAGFRGAHDATVRAMTDAMVHRGPDDSGIASGDNIWLGIRRLSIIDVAGGHQPIDSVDGRYSIVFNGEIYNYRDLRESLVAVGAPLRTMSDTEVILALYEREGPECLDRLRGMFAFAILDRRDGAVFLARDRLGIKPLYYWQNGGRLAFASEIKAILCCPDIPRDVHMPSLHRYLALRYVPGAETLFAGIRKFPAASYGVWRRGELKLVRYWNPPKETRSWAEDEAHDAFAEALDEATRLRMISERPVGAFLSGGLDSSAVVGSLSRQFSERLKTFTVGFGWEGDEIAAADETSKRLGLENHHVICTAEDAALLPRITYHLDEPVGDAIVLPMYLVARLAREQVVVVQSGEGADETMGGYLTHRIMRMAIGYERRVPSAITNYLINPLLRAAPADLLDTFFDYPGRLGNEGKDKLVDFLSIIGRSTDAQKYRFLVSLFGAGDRSRLLADQPDADVDLIQDDGLDAVSTDRMNGVLALQFRDWLPDDILMKQDKISMAVSLEARIPFMDHKLVELLMSMPYALKTRRGSTKRLIRKYLSGIGLDSPARRRKFAFYIPIDKYMRQEPLKGMLEELLSERSVRKRGLFRWEAVQALLPEKSGSGFVRAKQVMSLAMLEMWFRIFMDREPGWDG